MKKLFIIFVMIMMSFSFSSCDDFEAPLSLEQMRRSAFSCFSEHNEEMRDIVTRNLTTGETDWCKDHNVLTDGQYEFVLYRWGFTGTNICAGILFLPDDIPDEKFIQDANNSNIYTHLVDNRDQYHLERIEENWFYFYYEYDF